MCVPGIVREESSSCSKLVRRARPPSWSMPWVSYDLLQPGSTTTWVCTLDCGSALQPVAVVCHVSASLPAGPGPAAARHPALQFQDFPDRVDLSTQPIPLPLGLFCEPFHGFDLEHECGNDVKLCIDPICPHKQQIACHSLTGLQNLNWDGQHVSCGRTFGGHTLVVVGGERGMFCASDASILREIVAHWDGWLRAEESYC